MKKCILFLLFSVLSFGQAPDQMVSFNAAQSLGYSLNASQSHVNSDKCMTKDEALAKYNLATTANTNSIAGNQLMQKSFWETGITYYPHQVYDGSNQPGENATCTAYNTAGGLITLYSPDQVLVVGSYVYMLSDSYIIYYGGNYNHYSPSLDKLIRINNSSQITEITTCAPAYYTFTASSTDNLNDATACGYSPNITLYAKVANPVVGTILYTNTACTTAYSATVSRWRKWTGGGNRVMRYGTSIAELITCP